jgi:hypothetical protein
MITTAVVLSSPERAKNAELGYNAFRHNMESWRGSWPCYVIVIAISPNSSSAPPCAHSLSTCRHHPSMSLYYTWIIIVRIPSSHHPHCLRFLISSLRGSFKRPLDRSICNFILALCLPTASIAAHLLV